MTVTKTIAGIALVAALLAPQASAAKVEQAWLPRALPSDYVMAAETLPRAMPADYERSGVALIAQVGMPRAMPADFARYLASTSEQPGGRLAWIAAVTGAALVLAALGTAIMRRGRLRTA